MDNYLLARERARSYFCEYARTHPVGRPQAAVQEGAFCFPFLGAQTRVRQSDGEVTFSWAFGPDWQGNFEETLSVYDWLTHDPDAKAAGAFCPVYALPGVLVRGSGLSMEDQTLSRLADGAPDAFAAACRGLGGVPVELGDLAFQIPIFPGLDLLLKFYHGDEEFPPQMTYLWDRNSLCFLRYETVYYVSGCLSGRLRKLIQHFSK